MASTSQETGLLTRQTLLSRLKDWDDQQSWQDFFNTYWKLIYSTALGAGLTESEAQDVVQETIITVARQMPKFRYDGRRGSFKGWLLHTTRWRIRDQFRKRPPEFPQRLQGQEDTGTNELERVADPATAIDALWDSAWEQNLADAAIERVKLLVSPKDFQMFHLHVSREIPVNEVARKLHTTQARVYYMKYKVARLIRKEAKQLEAQLS